ncbi:hypothetical protein Bca52824_037077 [Brassica carinata]|uniref:NAC domain-containing protein n=1 Tax=Brassica carinata TaxID=52824 RepID=A0A8X7S638_BRACI|nr:hypothetical protein Bca52824_037077 [Brassica carinata]
MTDPVSGNDASAVKPIAPGFRFHPTDEELVTYYLKRKVQGKPMRFEAIGEVNVYKKYARLKTKDQEWFFFCALEKKHNSHTVINRATKTGYWKKTGLISVVKSLVFYKGRAPKGNRTNWIIHEYHLVGNKLEIDSYVLCRVFLKGPPTGCIYAPFSEQDWDDDGGGGINAKIQQENHLQSKNLSDDNNEEQLTRECIPFCVNKEAPFPLTQYKRKRQIDDSFGSYNNNSSHTTQDQCENEPEPVATMVPTTSSTTELIHHLEKEKQQMAVERGTYQLDLMSAEVMASFLQGKIDALRAENEELKKTTNSNKG